jgi:hypothetical protein
MKSNYCIPAAVTGFVLALLLLLGGDGLDAADAERGRGTSGGATNSSDNAEYNPCPTNGDCRILPLGDSITFGARYNGGYRVELLRKAHADGKHITFVGPMENGPKEVDGVAFPPNHAGYYGQSISAIGSHMSATALSESPHIVLLMAGTNDVRNKGLKPNAPKNMDFVLDHLSTIWPDALIVVAQITPITNTADWSRAAITFNAALPDVVKAHAGKGQHVVLVDMHTGFPSDGLADGTHPNKTGCDFMAGVWYSAIGRLLH